MNNNSVVNGYDYLTNSFPKETPPLDKDRILGIAKSSGLENPDFTSAVNYLRGEGEEGIVFLFVLYSSDMGQVHFVVTYLEIEGLFPR
jgi:hypothetical protein